MKASRLSLPSAAPLPEAVGTPAAIRAASVKVATVDPALVSERARALWRECGCPVGRDEEIWLDAERQLSGMGREPAPVDARKTDGGASGAGVVHATSTPQNRAV